MVPTEPDADPIAARRRPRPIVLMLREPVWISTRSGQHSGCVPADGRPIPTTPCRPRTPSQEPGSIRAPVITTPKWRGHEFNPGHRARQAGPDPGAAGGLPARQRPARTLRAHRGQADRRRRRLGLQPGHHAAGTVRSGCAGRRRLRRGSATPKGYKILKRIEATPFFGYVRRFTTVALYDDPETWAALGYEGSSFDKGGYLGAASTTWTGCPNRGSPSTTAPSSSCPTRPRPERDLTWRPPRAAAARTRRAVRPERRFGRRRPSAPEPVAARWCTT